MKDQLIRSSGITGKKIIITNAYTKSSQKMRKKDLEKLKMAIQYKENYLKRTERGNYYEI